MLHRLLSHGRELPLAEIHAEAAEWELSRWALKAAKKKLAVTTHRRRGVTYWSTPRRIAR